MGKRKFKMGNKIVSLDEMARQEHIYFHERYTTADGLGLGDFGG